MSGNNFSSNRPEHLSRVVSVENVREWRDKADSTFESHNSQLQALIKTIKSTMPNDPSDDMEELESLQFSSSAVQRIEKDDNCPQDHEAGKPKIDRLEVLARRIEAQLSNSRETSQKHHQLPEG